MPSRSNDRDPMKIQRLQHPLLNSLSDKEYQILNGVLTPIFYRPNDWICHEGDIGDACYLIIKGQVDVHMQTNHETSKEPQSEVLTRLRAGDLFGQMALIDRKPRSASGRAGARGVHVLKLSVNDFDQLFHSQSPFAFKIIDQVTQDLSIRLRNATKQLRKATQANDRVARARHSLEAVRALAHSEIQS